jgi:hypothetical protein
MSSGIYTMQYHWDESRGNGVFNTIVHSSQNPSYPYYIQKGSERTSVLENGRPYLHSNAPRGMSSDGLYYHHLVDGNTIRRTKLSDKTYEDFDITSSPVVAADYINLVDNDTTFYYFCITDSSDVWIIKINKSTGALVSNTQIADTHGSVVGISVHKNIFYLVSSHDYIYKLNHVTPGYDGSYNDVGEAIDTIHIATDDADVDWIYIGDYRRIDYKPHYMQKKIPLASLTLDGSVIAGMVYSKYDVLSECTHKTSSNNNLYGWQKCHINNSGASSASYDYSFVKQDKLIDNMSYNDTDKFAYHHPTDITKVNGQTMDITYTFTIS